MTKEKDTDKKPDKTAVWLGIVKRIAECRKQHMTWNQIAEATGMTAASAQSNWYRRKHLLEEGLEENVQETPEGEKPEETDAPEIPVTAGFARTGNPGSTGSDRKRHAGNAG